MSKTYRFTVTLTKTITFEEADLEGWVAKSFEEAAANEAKWLEGEDGEGSYLIMSIESGDLESKVTYEECE